MSVTIFTQFNAILVYFSSVYKGAKVYCTELFISNMESIV